MGRKDDILQEITQNDKKSYTKNEVLHIVSTMPLRLFPVKGNVDLRKGDVVQILQGAKVRPCVIIGFVGDMAYLIALSTTQDEMNLMETNDRLFAGYFSKGILSCEIEMAKKNFVGIFTNRKSLNEAIKKMKQIIMNF